MSPTVERTGPEGEPARGAAWFPAPGRNLLVNYVSVLGGSLSAKALSLVTVLMLTRVLGVEDFGRYTLVFSYWALLNSLVDFGGAQILGREIAKDPACPRPAVEAAVWVRLLGCLVFLPIGYAFAGLIGLSPDLALVALLGLMIGFEAFYEVYFSATMRLDQNAHARMLSSLLGVSLMALALLLRAPLPVVVLVGLGTPLLKLLYDYRFAPFKLRLHAPDWERIRQFARDGWPLWLMGLQYVLLARADVFMLQVLSPQGAYDMGIYSAAFRFSEIMALLINALCPAMLPLLVTHRQEPERIRFLAHTGLRLILSVLMAMSLFIFWYAPWIVAIYGPGYGASASAMQVLVWSQALVAVNSLCYQVLIVYNVQGRPALITASVLSTLLNIALNWWWIPQFRVQGAAWATVVSELAIVGFMLVFLARHTPLRLFKDLLIIEGLALLACLPVIPLGNAYGALSVVFFAGLVFGFRLLTPGALRQLALERLHAAPPNPRSSDSASP